MSVTAELRRDLAAAEAAIDELVEAASAALFWITVVRDRAEAQHDEYTAGAASTAIMNLRRLRDHAHEVRNPASPG